MKRILSALVVALVLWAQPASAQIASDASSGGGLFSTTWNHTVGVGSNRLLVVCEFDDNGGSNLLTAVTWDASGTPQPFTKINQAQTPGDRWVSEWYLVGPASGTKAITLTTTAGAMKGSAISFSGVGTLDQQNTVTASNSSPASASISVAANAWIVSCLKENVGGTVTWTNATEDATATGQGLHMAVGGPFTGSTNTSGSYNAGLSSALTVASFTVSGGAPPATSPAPCTLRLLGVGCDEVP